MPPDDPAALLEALRRLVGSRTLRATMSEHNRLVAQRFSITSTAAEYESLFSRVRKTVPARVCATA